jgi:hypothetical protein
VLNRAETGPPDGVEELILSTNAKNQFFTEHTPGPSFLPVSVFSREKQKRSGKRHLARRLVLKAVEVEVEESLGALRVQSLTPP